MVDFLRRVLTDEAAGTVDAIQRLFHDTNPGVVTVGVVSALWGGIAGIRSADQRP